MIQDLVIFWNVQGVFDTCEEFRGTVEQAVIASQMYKHYLVRTKGFCEVEIYRYIDNGTKLVQA